MVRELKVKVKDIGCPGCATDVRTVLLGLDGILHAEVGYHDETIAIEYDPEETGEDTILTAVKKMGLAVETVHSGSPAA